MMTSKMRWFAYGRELTCAAGSVDFDDICDHILSGGIFVNAPR